MAIKFLSFLRNSLTEIKSPVKWKGNYSSWETALSHSIGYDEDGIINKIVESANIVASGKAPYERDGVVFEQIQYSWPLLAGLLFAANNRGNAEFIIADFGGSLGSSYFQNKKFFSGVPIRWNVIEQDKYVKEAIKLSLPEELSFFNSITSYKSIFTSTDVLIISSTLQYLKNPYALIEELFTINSSFVIIDMTPFTNKLSDQLTIQTIREPIYNASYPCWLLSFEKVKNAISKNYEIIECFTNEVTIIINGKRIHYSGLIAKNKNLCA